MLLCKNILAIYAYITLSIDQKNQREEKAQIVPFPRADRDRW